MSFENKTKCQKINGNKRRKGLLVGHRRVQRDVGLERDKKVGLNEIIFQTKKSSTALGIVHKWRHERWYTFDNYEPISKYAIL